MLRIGSTFAPSSRTCQTELCVRVPQLGAVEVWQLEQGHRLQGELEEEKQQCEGSFSTT